MEIILGEEQIQALNSIKSFLKSKEVAISLTGFAGTGKSLVTKHIVNHLESNWTNYVLCAPTHIAKLVLEHFTEREAMTIHKLLSLSPNIEILNLDFKQLQFQTKGHSNSFPTKGVIICDEASMVNDELFDLLVDRCKLFESKLICIGDRAQIQPVNAFKYSKVFDLPNTITLTKIYRQSSESGLINILPKLREHVIPYFTDSLGTEGSLICNTDIKEFFKILIPNFKKAMNNSDILETKVLTYTNNRMRQYNAKIKELIFGTETEYNQHQFLTCYENITYNNMNFWNSMDYIVIDKPEETRVPIPYFMELPGWELNLFDPATKSVGNILILKSDVTKDYLDTLAYLIESIRLDAIACKYHDKQKSKNLWKKYYEIINSFTSPWDLMYENRVIRKKTFDHGFAATSHKSQGKSFNNVFIDLKDLMVCRNQEELRQLEYVAVSRARQNVYIYQ